MRLAVIVAIADDNVIGFKGGIPWHIPDDLEFFRKTTGNNPMIMGRKTFESLPKVLQGRRHLVVTSDRTRTHADPLVSFHSSFDEALLEASNCISDVNETIYAIGGASIYASALPMADTVYITNVYKEFEGDVKFPDFDFMDYDIRLSDEIHMEPDGLEWDRDVLMRKHPLVEV